MTFNQLQSHFKDLSSLKEGIFVLGIFGSGHHAFRAIAKRGIDAHCIDYPHSLILATRDLNIPVLEHRGLFNIFKSVIGSWVFKPTPLMESSGKILLNAASYPFGLIKPNLMMPNLHHAADALAQLSVPVKIIVLHRRIQDCIMSAFNRGFADQYEALRLALDGRREVLWQSQYLSDSGYPVYNLNFQRFIDDPIRSATELRDFLGWQIEDFSPESIYDPILVRDYKKDSLLEELLLSHAAALNDLNLSTTEGGVVK